MDHPFHQHVNAAQILSVTGGDPGYASLYARLPAWKDTVLVPKGGNVTLLVPVRDFEGMAMFHCHILEHEDIGMMGVWNIEGKERHRDKPSRPQGSYPCAAHSEGSQESTPGTPHDH